MWRRQVVFPHRLFRVSSTSVLMFQIATRAHVWETIQRLGYKPNTLARGLVSQRSHSLGIITLPLHDFFRAEIMTGLEQQARALGYACQISYSNDECQRPSRIG